MKVVQIVPHYIPATRFGGPQRVAHFLGKALLKLGHQVTVCTTNLQDEFEDLDVPVDVPVDVDGVCVFYEPVRLSRYWGFSPALARRVKEEIKKADVVLVHAHYQFANLIGARLARKARKPYIIFAHASLHRHGVSHKSGLLKRLYLRFLERANLRGAQFIAFNAPEEKEASFYSELGLVIPNGIDPAEFADMPPAGSFRSRYPQLKDKLLFVFLGRLDVQQKGLDNLIPAFARLRRNYPAAHLILAGPNEDSGLDSVGALAKEKHIEDAITFTGLIAGKDKLAALQDADVFVLPSRFEGLSIALLEALFVGLPVLVTDRVGLCNEVAEATAGLVVASESESIYAGLNEISDSETRQQMRGRGTQLILRSYTWDTIAQQLIDKVKIDNFAPRLSLGFSKAQTYLSFAVADSGGGARELIATVGDEEAFKMAHENQVASHVAHALMADRGHDNVPAHWQMAHKKTDERISAYMVELDRIAALLDKEGIPLVALKNAGIARGIYDCLGCCPMGDLDVLVERRHFCRAHQILTDDGYHFEFRSPLEEAGLEVAEKSGGAEYWKILSNGEKLWFELQWRPVAGRWIRPDQEPSAEDLMARSVPIAGTVVRLLSPEDNLIQVSLHTAKHTYVRAPGFRLHTDVDRIVRRQPLDWDLFLKRMQELEVKTAVYFSLAIPKAIFQTPVPDEVLERLKPSKWKEQLITKWLQSAGLFNPDKKKFGRLGYVLFTSLLHDDLSGLWRGMFPNRRWMRDRYGFTNNLLLPYYHLRRIADLIVRRAST